MLLKFELMANLLRSLYVTEYPDQDLGLVTVDTFLSFLTCDGTKVLLSKYLDAPPRGKLSRDWLKQGYLCLSLWCNVPCQPSLGE